MHESLRLYDAALELVAEEAKALDHEEEERLEELFEARTSLMEEAWRKRDGCAPELLAQKLEAVRLAQSLLARKATIARDTLRLALQSSRKESGRLAGYGRVTQTGQSALILSKEG